jgi:thiamine thiazole synthase
MYKRPLCAGIRVFYFFGKEEVMFAKTSEANISRAILREFAAWFDEYLKSDVVVVGGGPSGLVAARDLAKSGFKTLMVESNNYLGGGFWIGGF